ncbi:MAG: carboxy-S-adenosyl-L-methionine synthase CmoA [Gammaproteobacteria bacterium]
MSRDQIYTGDGDPQGPFEFSEDVAKVFPDMLERSIPGYAMTIHAIGSLARRYVRAGTICYDLGCSLGAAAMAMRDGIAEPGCRVVAVDNAPAMVERCKDSLGSTHDVDVSVLEADLRDIDISNASLVVMNYTLQFLPIADRLPLLQAIHDGLNPGGVLVLSEKVADGDEAIESLLVDLHHGFKRRNAYSELEISRKRAALENVLIPESIVTHRERLAEAGFRHVGVWQRHFNFVSMVAFR